MISFILPGVPKAQVRPRVCRNVTYDPLKPKKRADRVYLESNYRFTQIKGKCGMKISFFMPIPESYSKRKRLALEGDYHVKRPDLDNLIKYILDLLNGWAYLDDSLVCQLQARKVYDVEPRVEIKLWEL